MPSRLKRKRGSKEVFETPKRVRSAQIQDTLVLKPWLDGTKTEWDAAFGGSEFGNDLQNGKRKISDPLESLDLETLDQQQNTLDHSGEEGRGGAQATWKVTESIGGRMLDLDPVFSEDEKYIIIAHSDSLRIYSTSHSLLHRVIILGGSRIHNLRSGIVSYALSPTVTDRVWVACGDGALYSIDWTTGEGADTFWFTTSIGTSFMTVASIGSAGRTRDIIYTTEGREEGGWRITAHEFSQPGTKFPTVARTIYTSTESVQILKASSDGQIIVAASGSRVLIGDLRSTNFDTVDKIKYEFRIFSSSDYVSCLDIRLTDRPTNPGVKISKKAKSKLLDIVVGDVKGVIFIHTNILANLVNAAEGQKGLNLTPRKLHWHRKPVQSIKFSLDGSYIISGGSETVMVLWQLDTGKSDFLPHMSATINNIVVSPTGTSYGIHLADNSTMIMSTSELTPTANVSGIQAHVIQSGISHDARVARIEEERTSKPFIGRTPALINPAQPSHLLLAVGDTQSIDPYFPLKSSVPYLQTFDVSSSHNVSRQALTRTNVTNIKIAPGANRISEAQVTHMKVSHDGQWLATVDEWIPPRKDVEHLHSSSADLAEEQSRRREVYLKFWQWSEVNSTWELVARIDAPHSMALEKSSAGKILDLAVSPTSYSFATIGEDITIRIWRPQSRKRDGVLVKDKDGIVLANWKCQSVTRLVLFDSQYDAVHRQPEHGSLTFSEDGSILAGALSGSDSGIIHLMNASTGVVYATRTNMYSGEIIALGLLGQYLIIVSSEIRVYNLVLDTCVYTVSLNPEISLLSLQQRANMIHFVINPSNSTFAVGLPAGDTATALEGTHHSHNSDGGPVKQQHRIVAQAKTSIHIFSPQNALPIFTHQHPSLATALLPAGGGNGYVILDVAALVTMIIPTALEALTGLARPLVELRMDLKNDNGSVAADEDDLDDESEEMGEVEYDSIAAADMAIEDMTDILEDDDGPPVITQQHLSSVFDIGPAFALPPMEELFFRVVNLVAEKA